LFLHNAWYVAAWDHEVTQEPRPVKLLDQRIVLFRTASGQPVALEDACPHRKLPLSMGRVLQEEIECGYHGLVFDIKGACKHIPGVKNVPRSVCVRSYPAVSRYGLVWVWMGDRERADEKTIFTVEHWQETGWGCNRGGSMVVDCNYLFVTDNLLDPSHVAWVHRTSFGNEGYEDAPVETTRLPDGILASRWLYNVEVAPFYSPFVAFSGPCDRLQHYEVRYPSHAIIRAMLVPAGSGGNGRPLPQSAFLMDSYNFMTPIDAEHTLYFWFQMRNFSPQDEAVSRVLDEGVRQAFAEDQRILNAVQQGFTHKTTPNIDLGIDRAGIEFRRALASLIAAEKPGDVGGVSAG
jgi:phenylpropionate dioxygenase-like ring-hydroxylating dioxygenase large terminal subunit